MRLLLRVLRPVSVQVTAMSRLWCWLPASFSEAGALLMRMMLALMLMLGLY